MNLSLYRDRYIPTANNMAEVNYKGILATALPLLVTYLFIRRYQIRKVSYPLNPHNVMRSASLLTQTSSQADALYAEQHNCQPLKTLPYKWPLGLDLLWTAYHHAVEGRILRFFTALINTVPPTFEQRLLGISGVDTVDPKNIEAVLGTNFSGMPILFPEH